MSYAQISDMILRFDQRILGDLVSDTGVQVTNLTGNVVIQACLDSAAGEINSAALVAARYTIAQLEALTDVDMQLLIDINCSIAWERLRLRRGLPMAGWPQIEAARKWLELMRGGNRVFNFAGAEQAGLAQDYFPSMQFYQDLNLLRDRSTGPRAIFTPRRTQSNM